MRGTIIDFNRTSGEGLIRGEDGNRYEYSAIEFKSDVAPRQGQEVDFEVKDGRATAVYALATKGINIDVNDAAQRISAFAKEVGVDTTARKVLQNLKDGPKDRIGVGLAAAAVICLFLPFMHVPFLGSVSLIETGWGKLLFVVALAIAFLCYQGMDRKWVKVAACAFATVAVDDFAMRACRRSPSAIHIFRQSLHHCQARAAARHEAIIPPQKPSL
jgi:cold shock CspA family protein